MRKIKNIERPFSTACFAAAIPMIAASIIHDPNHHFGRYLMVIGLVGIVGARIWAALAEENAK